MPQAWGGSFASGRAVSSGVMHLQHAPRQQLLAVPAAAGSGQLWQLAVAAAAVAAASLPAGTVPCRQEVATATTGAAVCGQGRAAKLRGRDELRSTTRPVQRPRPARVA